ncbi:hypothetical protein NDU88_009980 [Pleurodeles waltl]|uniref:Uncharacterized protein n=1 Tax=Pleurodeles waltl TaxID=8319 RepID=A0AAV7Q0W5_PLEWA|nr:hypothetical protein NDU88_009980 [Pleurodeles waltl]
MTGRTGPTRTPERLVLPLPCTTRKHPRERGSRLAPHHNRVSRCRLKGWNHTLKRGEEGMHGGDRRRQKENPEQNSGGRGPKTSWKSPGPVSNPLENSGSLEPRGPENTRRIAGPGKQTNKPATLQEKRGQARYGNSGREGKREREEGGGKARKSTGSTQKGLGEGNSRVVH